MRAAFLLLTIAASSVTSVAADEPTIGDRLKEVAAKAERARQAAAAAAPGVQRQIDGFQPAWNNAVTSVSTSAFMESMSSTTGLLKRLFGLTESAIRGIFTAVANLSFCLIMLIGFVYLPAEVMFVVCLITIFIGPALVLGLLALLGDLTYIAMWAPMIFVLILFVVALCRTYAVEAIAKRLGLDLNGDGSVNMKDIVRLAQRSSWYQKAKSFVVKSPAAPFVRLDSMETALTAVSGPPDLKNMQQQIDRLEKNIELLLKAHKIDVAHMA